jgi:hypothetical protein
MGSHVMEEERQSVSPLPTGRFESRELFADLVRQALACAAQEGWPLVVLSDPDFADWPLGERVVVDALQRWAARGRHLRFLTRDFSVLRQQHPRLVQWRTNWSHLIEAHACPGASGSELPSAIWSATWTMERLDLQRGTVVASVDAKRRTALKERLDSTWHKGTPSFAATTLGL